MKIRKKNQNFYSKRQDCLHRNYYRINNKNNKKLTKLSEFMMNLGYKVNI